MHNVFILICDNIVIVNFVAMIKKHDQKMTDGRVCLTPYSWRVRAHYGVEAWQQVAGMGVGQGIWELTSQWQEWSRKTHWKWREVLKARSPPPAAYFLQERPCLVNLPQTVLPTRNQVFKYLSLWGTSLIQTIKIQNMQLHIYNKLNIRMLM